MKSRQSGDFCRARIPKPRGARRPRGPTTIINRKSSIIKAKARISRIHTDSRRVCTAHRFLACLTQRRRDTESEIRFDPAFLRASSSPRASHLPTAASRTPQSKRPPPPPTINEQPATVLPPATAYQPPRAAEEAVTAHRQSCVASREPPCNNGAKNRQPYRLPNPLTRGSRLSIIYDRSPEKSNPKQ